MLRRRSAASEDKSYVGSSYVTMRRFPWTTTRITGNIIEFCSGNTNCNSTLVGLRCQLMVCSLFSTQHVGVIVWWQPLFYFEPVDHVVFSSGRRVQSSVDAQKPSNVNICAVNLYFLAETFSLARWHSSSGSFLVLGHNNFGCEYMHFILLFKS